MEIAKACEKGRHSSFPVPLTYSCRAKGHTAMSTGYGEEGRKRGVREMELSRLKSGLAPLKVLDHSLTIAPRLDDICIEDNTEPHCRAHRRPMTRLVFT